MRNNSGNDPCGETCVCGCQQVCVCFNVSGYEASELKEMGFRFEDLTDHCTADEMLRAGWSKDHVTRVTSCWNMLESHLNLEDYQLSSAGPKALRECEGML